MNWAKIGLFAGGALFGSAGIEILTSKDAKKLYTQCTAAVLRMKDQVMKTATTLQENCGDILADAREINEQRAAEDDAVVEDTAEEMARPETPRGSVRSMHSTMFTRMETAPAIRGVRPSCWAKYPRLRIFCRA